MDPACAGRYDICFAKSYDTIAVRSQFTKKEHWIPNALFFGAGDRGRTCILADKILNLACMPISPHPRAYK